MAGSGQKKKPKGLPKRTGKRKSKIAQYYGDAFIENKLRHILARNGVVAAQAWAADHLADAVLRRLRNL